MGHALTWYVGDRLCLAHPHQVTKLGPPPLRHVWWLRVQHLDLGRQVSTAGRRHAKVGNDGRGDLKQRGGARRAVTTTCTGATTTTASASASAASATATTAHTTAHTTVGEASKLVHEAIVRVDALACRCDARQRINLADAVALDDVW